MRQRRSAPAGPSSATGVESFCDLSFSTAEATLLCCFGTDQLAQRSHKALRAALKGAGLSTRATGYLIRRSPLLELASRGQYRLRPCPTEPLLS